MLFSRFGINYNEISDRFKKGSVVVREVVESSNKHEQPEPPIPSARSETERECDESPERPATTDPPASIQLSSQLTDDGDKTPPPDLPRQKRTNGKKKKVKLETTIEVLHCDIISDEFWLTRPHLLEKQP